MPQASCLLSLALSAAFTMLGADVPAKCCFTNPAYTGVCEVVPKEDETCRSILDYLNSPNSSGKPYCGGTILRGGWQQTTCPADAGAGRLPPQPGPAGRAGPGFAPPPAR